MEVYPEGRGWNYYIHDFDYPELDCFGTLESEGEAKKKAVKIRHNSGSESGSISVLRSSSLGRSIGSQT